MDPKIAEILKPNNFCVVLIKPQFECGKDIAKKFKGIIQKTLWQSLTKWKNTCIILYVIKF